MSRTVHVWDRVGRSGTRHVHAGVGAVQVDGSGVLRLWLGPTPGSREQLAAAYAAGEWRRFEYASPPPDDRPEHLRSLPRGPVAVSSSAEPPPPPE